MIVLQRLKQHLTLSEMCIETGLKNCQTFLQTERDAAEILTTDKMSDNKILFTVCAVSVKDLSLIQHKCYFGSSCWRFPTGIQFFLLLLARCQLSLCGAHPSVSIF